MIEKVVWQLLQQYAAAAGVPIAWSMRSPALGGLRAKVCHPKSDVTHLIYFWELGIYVQCVSNLTHISQVDALRGWG
jgi:hypothetical protein